MKNSKINIIVNILIIVSFVTMFTKGYVLKSDNAETDFVKNAYVKKGYITLLDNYDSDSSNVYTFFREKNSLKIMEKTEKELKKIHNYYYIDIQDAYIKNYKRIFGDDKKFLVDKESITTNEDVGLKAVQIDDKFLKKSNFAIEDKIKDNKYMTIYLGENYKKYYNAGDIVELGVYGDKYYKFVVSGFIKEPNNNEYVNVLKDIGSIDDIKNYIVIPNLFLEKKDSQYKINMLQRCEGIMKINSVDEYIKAINSVERIAKKTGFKYDYKIYSTPNNSNERKKDKLITIISIITFLCCGIVKIIATREKNEK